MAEAALIQSWKHRKRTRATRTSSLVYSHCRKLFGTARHLSTRVMSQLSFTHDYVTTQ